MVVHFLDKCDLIFGIGTSFTRIHHGMDKFDDKTLVQITNCSDDLNKDYDVDHAVLGDAELVLESLISEIEQLLDSRSETQKFDFTDEIHEVRQDWMLSLIHI